MSASQASARVVYLPGDGVGPEVGAAALTVLDAVKSRFGVEFALEEHAFGGAAIDAHGEPFPPETRDAVAKADAVLLGAVGGPKWDGLSGPERPESGLLALRKTMDVWANIRMFKPHPRALGKSPLKAERLADVDIAVVRELTGGAYFGAKSRDAVRAMDECVYTVPEIERIVRRAAALTKGRKDRLASIDKANVMETGRLWRDVTTRIMADEFPEVEIAHVLVDAAAMHLIQDPARFDVIVAENMFGDILTDEAAVLTGSLGLIPSASLGDGAEGRFRGLYEPAHGSAPDIAGRGVANPAGMILSAALMLRHSLGAPEAADAVERAVDAAMTDGVLTADLAENLNDAASTTEMSTRIISALD